MSHRNLSGCPPALRERRPSFYPSRTEESPVSFHLFQFRKELHKTLSLSTTCSCGCVGVAPDNETSLDTTQDHWRSALLCNEQELPQVRHSLFLREIKHVNPNLADGYMIVDGLYEYLTRCVPWPSDTSHTHNVDLTGSPRDMLTMSSTGSLLQKYWSRPDDPQDISLYLTIASSMVSFLLERYGSRGLLQFMKKMECNKTQHPSDFHFKGMDILSLEFKWKKFVEAEVNKKFRLSTCGMLAHLLRHYLAQYWLRLLVVMVILILDITITLAFAVYSGKIFRLGFTADNGVEVAKLGGMLVGMLLFRFILLNCSSGLLVTLAVQVSSVLHRRIAGRLQSVTPQFLLDHCTPSILQTFSHDVASVELLIAVCLRAFLKGILMMLTCLVFSLVVAWPLGVGLLLVVLTSQLILNCVSTVTSKASFAKSQALSKVSGMLKEALDGFRENRIFCTEYYWSIMLEQTLSKLYYPKNRRVLFMTEFVILSQQVVAMSVGLFLIVGSTLLALYDIVAFENGIAIFLFFAPTVISVTTAASLFTQLQAASVGLGRINALLSNTDHELSPTNSCPPLVLSPKTRQNGASVVFNNVCYSYSPTASHWALYDVSFSISAGEKVVIVGGSGSGKSTILNLILQLYLPTRGAVVIAGRQTNGKSSKIVAATFQANHMFHLSVKDNIRFGNLNASDQQIEEAAKMADIHNWVMSLPRHYDTVLRSSSLSGGQKQRIAIARMLLACAPVLVLDEVTSALDPSTEARVFTTLMEVTRGRSVVAVTHRLEQARFFDRILIVSHGRIKEEGTHVQLMAAKGSYYNMVMKERKDPSPNKATPISHRHSLSHLDSSKPISISELEVSSTPQAPPNSQTLNRKPKSFLNRFTPRPRSLPQTLISTKHSPSLATPPLLTADIILPHSASETSNSTTTIINPSALSDTMDDTETPIPVKASTPLLARVDQ